MSNASSVRLKAEMERAALIAQATASKQKQDFERQEAELKATRVEFDLQMTIAAFHAKLKVIENFENDCLSQVIHAQAITIDSIKCKSTVYSINCKSNSCSQQG